MAADWTSTSVTMCGQLYPADLLLRELHDFRLLLFAKQVSLCRDFVRVGSTDLRLPTPQDGRTALFLAAAQDNGNVLQILLRNNADANIPDAVRPL